MNKNVSEKWMLVLTNEVLMSTFGGYAPPEKEEPEFGDPDYFKEIMKWY